MKNLVPLILVVCFFSAFVACQKIADIQPDKPVLPGVKVTQSNWAFQLSDTSFSGIVDTAYSVSSEGISNIVIQGSDTAGNTINITLSTKEKKFIVDAYTSLYGRAFISFQKDTSYYASYKDSGSCTFEITKINDSLIEGNYSAVLIDKASHKLITVKSGSIKAFFKKGNSAENNNNQEPGNGDTPDNGGYYWKVDGNVYAADITMHDSVDIYNTWEAFCLQTGYRLDVEFNANAVKDGSYNVTDSVGYMLLNNDQARIFFYDYSITYYMAKAGTITVATKNNIRTATFSDIVFQAQSDNPDIASQTKTISGFINLKP